MSLAKNPGVTRITLVAFKPARVSPAESVPGCALMPGNSTVCAYCKGQAVIALRSGKAEYCGLVSATSQMLGLQEYSPGTGDGNSKPMCGWMPQRRLRLEADEDLDECSISTQCFFWCRRWSRKAKSRFERNPPKKCLQTFTKHVDAATMLNCVAELGLRFQSGESKLTLKA